MQAKVLIIEDEKDMADLISLYLSKEGVKTTICESAEKGLESFNKGNYDLIILDINLPGMDGFEFLQKIRKENTVPVIIVSAREADEDIIMGLGIGADEFVVKPFSPRVLTARVRAVLRRAKDLDRNNLANAAKNVVFFGDFELDLDSYILKKKIGLNEPESTGAGSGYKDFMRIPLSLKEFEVLKYLAENAGHALSPEDIYGAVWGAQFGDLTAVAVYIQRLRRKIENDPSHPVFLETVRGRGYRFNRG